MTALRAAPLAECMAGARKGASKPNKEMDKGHAHACLITFPAEVCEGVNNAMEDRSSRRNRELGIRTAQP